jgi:hypothetical protein
MHMTRLQIHHWILSLAAALALVALMLPKPAHAQGTGLYTTTGTSTSTSSTDAVTGVTTTTINSSTTSPAGIYRSGSDRNYDYWRNARNSGSNANWRDRAAREGFPDAAQANKDEASGSASCADPVERNTCVIDQTVTPGEFRRRRASARGIGIEAEVHIE